MQSLLPQSVCLLVVGLNHRTAPLDVRETLAFTPERARAAIELFKRRFPAGEAVILSTGNRVELYIARPEDAEPSLETLTGFLAEFHALSADQLGPHLYHHQDRAMVEHLFRVASSLDSMVVGETQILAQVKQAYQLAGHAGSAGKIFHALFQRALAAAKDVHDRTELSAGRLSVASVAVELARSVFDRFDDKTILCIGAGKMVTLMLYHLRELAPHKLLITNRSFDRARRNAEEFRGEAREFDQLDQLLVEADIILTSTGSPEPIITAPGFKGLLKARRYRPAVIVDIAVPRDVEAAVGDLSNVYLYNVDDLQDVAAGNRQKRDREIAASKTLLDGHVEEFLHWFAARDIGPLVKALYEHCNQLAQAEIEQFCTRHPGISAGERADMERLAHRLVGKILHGPVTRINAQTQAAADPMLASAMRQLFSLEFENRPPPEQPPAAPSDSAP